MIYDVACFCLWKFVIPLTDGRPATRYFQHRARDWFVVWDPDRIPHVYWEERDRRVRRNSPPHIDRDVGVQTMGDAWGQMPPDVVHDTGVQTNGDV